MMEVSTIFTVLAITVSVLVIYYKWIFGFWKRRNVQTLQPNFFFGNLSNVIFGQIPMVDIFEKTYREFKSKGYKYAGYYFLVKPVLVILDPNLIEQIFVKDFSHFMDHPMHMDKENDPLTANLLGLKGTEWKNVRNIITPAMSSNKLKMMFDIFISKSNNLINVVEEACKSTKEVNMKELTTKFIVDIIGTCFFGLECDSLLNKENEFIRILQTQTNGIIQSSKFLTSLLYPTLLKRLGLQMSHPDALKFYLSITKQTVEYREKNNVVRNDLMQLLIQLRNNINIDNQDTMDLKGSGLKGGKKLLTTDEIAAQLFAFFAAGSETSSSAITFCLYELVQNPKLQDKLRKEINCVLEKNKGEISYDNLMEMPFLDMCINETIRKYPTLPFLTRECTKDWVMPGTNLLLKKGSQVYVPVLQIQNDPEYFPNPEQFDPERFLPENKSNIHPNAFVPFGDGPRICIGKRLGLLKVKIGLTVLLKNFKFTLSPKTIVPLEKEKKEFFFAVKNGIWLNVEKI